MAERRPLVIIAGQVQELPTVDSTPGTGSASSSYREPVCVLHAGAPEIVFINSGDVVCAPGEA